MKIAVIGAGAMGSIYAALLADAGNEVWAVDTWGAHVKAIQDNGLRVSGASGERTVRSIHATTNVGDVGVCDLYIIATKAAGVVPAAQAISGQMGADSLVLTIQNGLGAGDRIAEHMPTENVLLGVADGFGASMAGPGHAQHTSMKLIRIGEMSGGMTDRLRRVEGVWQAAGFNAQAFEDINQLIWEKFLCNVTLSAPCTAFGMTVTELKADPARWSIALGCMREAYAVGQALGIRFGFDNAEVYVTNFANAVGNAKPSMLQDHEARRASELDAINGRVPILGVQLGIATPYNSTLTEVLRAREASF
jgi:2-dehydropantoate 2-reductase